MEKIGFIGYGSMGSMLIHGMIDSGKVMEKAIVVSTRSKEKLLLLQKKYKHIGIVQTNLEVVQQAKTIFLCVKPHQVEEILGQLATHLTPDHHFVSIAFPNSIESIERITGGKVSKLLPSLTSEVFDGIALLSHGVKVTSDDGDFIEWVLEKMCTVKVYKEEDLDITAEIISCGPAFFAAMLKEFVQSALKRIDGISGKELDELVVKTMRGTARLMTQKEMSFDEIITRVATKGGITEEGIKSLNERLPETFDDMFTRTLNKRDSLK